LLVQPSQPGLQRTLSNPEYIGGLAADDLPHEFPAVASQSDDLLNRNTLAGKLEDQPV
jgi:hypothetical protein